MKRPPLLSKGKLNEAIPYSVSLRTSNVILIYFILVGHTWQAKKIKNMLAAAYIGQRRIWAFCLRLLPLFALPACVCPCTNQAFQRNSFSFFVVLAHNIVLYMKVINTVTAAFTVALSLTLPMRSSARCRILGAVFHLHVLSCSVAISRQKAYM